VASLVVIGLGLCAAMRSRSLFPRISRRLPGGSKRAVVVGAGSFDAGRDSGFTADGQSTALLCRLPCQFLIHIGALAVDEVRLVILTSLRASIVILGEQVGKSPNLSRA
jgi:hypothetical protein